MYYFTKEIIITYDVKQEQQNMIDSSDLLKVKFPELCEHSQIWRRIIRKSC